MVADLAVALRRVVLRRVVLRLVALQVADRAAVVAEWAE